MYLVIFLFWNFCNSIFESVFFDLATKMYVVFEKFKGNKIVEVNTFVAINAYFLLCWFFIFSLLSLGFFFRQNKLVYRGLIVTTSLHILIYVFFVF